MRLMGFKSRCAWKPESYSARSYVQDGLVSLFDGIENAGWGTHDNSARVWKDLAGGADLTLKNGAFVDDAFAPSVNDISYGAYREKAAFAGTVEIAYLYTGCRDTTEEERAVILTDGERRGLFGFKSGFNLITFTAPQYGFNNTALRDGNVHSVSIDYVNSTVRVDDEPQTVTESSRAQGLNAYMAISGRYLKSGSNGNPFSGKVFSVRIYNRVLTPEEIAINYAVDCKRFKIGGGS